MLAATIALVNFRQTSTGQCARGSWADHQRRPRIARRAAHLSNVEACRADVARYNGSTAHTSGFLKVGGRLTIDPMFPGTSTLDKDKVCVKHIFCVDGE